jgi:PhoH-like ATPase
MPRQKRKIFVLDTNVILHDSSCIHHFQENDVVIPIPVLEELDSFKKGNESLNYHAREFVRTLDSLSGDKLFDGGVRIGPDLGKISIKLEREFHPDLGGMFNTHKPDHQILNIAYHIAKEHPDRPLILVSKDVNLRIKAKSIGLLAQDYKTDHVKNISDLYTGHRVVDDVQGDLIAHLYQEPGEVSITEIEFDTAPIPNEFFILRNGKMSALATYRYSSRTLRRVDKIPSYGIVPRNAEQTFALAALLDNDIKLVSMSGKAGTGKTLLALAAALQKRKDYRQIYMARPVVPLSNKDIGFLPGDIHSKLDPYMQPLYDNLGVIRYSETDARSPASTAAGGGEAGHRPAGLHSRAQPGENLFHRGRGAEPDPARGEDHHHARGRGNQDRIHGRHLPDRPSLSRQQLQRAQLPDRENAGPTPVCTYQPDEGRTERTGGTGERFVVTECSGRGAKGQRGRGRRMANGE